MKDQGMIAPWTMIQFPAGGILLATYSRYRMFGSRKTYEIRDDIVVAYTSGKSCFCLIQGERTPTTNPKCRPKSARNAFAVIPSPRTSTALPTCQAFFFFVIPRKSTIDLASTALISLAIARESMMGQATETYRDVTPAARLH